jgi:hypothetical protein
MAGEIGEMDRNLPEVPNTPPTSEISASKPRKHHPAITDMITNVQPLATHINDGGIAAR